MRHQKNTRDYFNCSKKSFKEMDVPKDKMFRIKCMNEVPKYAPIFASVKCSICGENVMETKARVKEGKFICMTCATP